MMAEQYLHIKPPVSHGYIPALCVQQLYAHVDYPYCIKLSHNVNVQPWEGLRIAAQEGWVPGTAPAVAMALGIPPGSGATLSERDRRLAARHQERRYDLTGVQTCVVVIRGSQGVLH